MEIELFGGRDSAVNRVPLNATAFAKRNTLFTIQFLSTSADGAPPYPQEGFAFMDGEFLPSL